MFKTRKIRETEREARLAQFSECSVRVIFQDQTWIQARFSALETLADIYAFVRGVLAQDRPFYLYTTPPPTKLADSKSDMIKYTQVGWGGCALSCILDGWADALPCSCCRLLASTSPSASPPSF